MSKLMQIRAESSARMDPVAARRNPSPSDVATRDRAVLTLAFLWAGAALTLTVLGGIKRSVDIDLPGVVLAIPGVPGIAALIVLIICRDPRRRDWSLKLMIGLSMTMAAIVGVVSLLAGVGVALGVYWALVLGSVLTCGALYWRWRTR